MSTEKGESEQTNKNNKMLFVVFFELNKDQTKSSGKNRLKENNFLDSLLSPFLFLKKIAIDTIPAMFTCKTVL